MITTLPKPPNGDNLQADGAPKSAFKCVQRRCRSPTMLSSQNDMKNVTNNVQSQSHSVIQQQHPAAFLQSTTLDKHNMFPQFYIPSSLLCSTNQLNGQDGKFAELVQFGMINNNKVATHDKTPEERVSNPSTRMEQIATLAHIQSRLSNLAEYNISYDSTVDENAQKRLNPKLEIGLNSNSNLIYQNHPDEDRVFGTRVPATTQSDKCHQRTRVMMQHHHQSPEKMRRYK